MQVLFREKDLVDFITGPGKKLRVVRFYSDSCPHCIATAEDFSRMAEDGEMQRAASFCAIDIKNIACPKTLPKISKMPTISVYSRHCGCISSRPGGSVDWVRAMVAQRM